MFFFSSDSSKSVLTVAAKATERSSVWNTAAVSRRSRGNIVLNRFGTTLKAPAEPLQNHCRHFEFISIWWVLASHRHWAIQSGWWQTHKQSVIHKSLGDIILTFYSLKPEFTAWWRNHTTAPLNEGLWFKLPKFVKTTWRDAASWREQNVSFMWWEQISSGTINNKSAPVQLSPAYRTCPWEMDCMLHWVHWASMSVCVCVFITFGTLSSNPFFCPWRIQAQWCPYRLGNNCNTWNAKIGPWSSLPSNHKRLAVESEVP